MADSSHASTTVHPDVAAKIFDEFIEMYGSHTVEGVRLYRKYGERVALCLDEPPTDKVEPGLTLVGKKQKHLMDELDVSSPYVQYLIHQFKTYDPEHEALFVLQFSRSYVISGVLRQRPMLRDSDDDSDDEYVETEETDGAKALME